MLNGSWKTYFRNLLSRSWLRQSSWLSVVLWEALRVYLVMTYFYLTLYNNPWELPLEADRFEDVTLILLVAYLANTQ